MKKIVFLDASYDIEKDKGNCFNYEEIEKLITDYFTPYDYILGDYSYGKLRLKGFYDEKNKKANNINKYSYIDDYITNFCAYNCKYFILKKIKKEIF